MVVVTGGARSRVDASRTVVLAEPDALRGRPDGDLFANCATPLLLVDGNNLLWRAAHGHPAPFHATDGRDITPVFRFFSTLRRTVGSWGVFAEVICCFDGSDAWRHRLTLDAGYKSNRDYDGKDVSFMEWLPEIHAALRSAGVVTVEIDDQEADDVIATVAAGAGERPVRILSTDRDYYQLVSSRLTVVNPRARPSLVDEATVLSAYGVSPRRWCDFRALAGDPSDGIPGVAGIGPKRAAKLLAETGTLEDLRASGLLDAAWDDVLRWRELIRLRTDVGTGVELTGEPTPKLPGPVAVCRELGLSGYPLRSRGA